MNFRNISSWCIRNPVGPIVLFVGLMLAGLISFARMQVNNAPDIDFPAAIVSVSQPGAAPGEMETQVTQRVESAVRGITGVEEISSTIREGNSTTFVQFELGTPTDRAVNDVRNVVAQIRSNLPDGILEPQVQRVDAEDEPFSYIGAQTTDMTLEQLSWYIDNTIAKRLLGLEGVAAVTRVGGVDRNVRVILDPAALQAQGITAAQVNQQLRQSNMNGAGGRAEAFADADLLAGRPLRETGRPRRGQGQQQRTAFDREDERPPGRHLHDPARQGFVGSDGVRRRVDGTEEAGEGEPKGPLLRGLQHRRLHQGAI
jgi:multidrug efflux pump subunit AcrB